MKNKDGFTTWACGYFSQVYDDDDDNNGDDDDDQGNEDDLMMTSQEISNNFEQLYREHKQEFANVWREIATRLKCHHHQYPYHQIGQQIFESTPS